MTRANTCSCAHLLGRSASVASAGWVSMATGGGGECGVNAAGLEMVPVSSENGRRVAEVEWHGDASGVRWVFLTHVWHLHHQQWYERRCVGATQQNDSYGWAAQIFQQLQANGPHRMPDPPARWRRHRARCRKMESMFLVFAVLLTCVAAQSGLRECAVELVVLMVIDCCVAGCVCC